MRMSTLDNRASADFIDGLDDEGKHEILERLAEELGFQLTEPVDPQSEIVDVVAGAIRGLQTDLGVLQAQFADGGDLDYTELAGAAERIEAAVEALSEAHGNLMALLESEFELDEYEEEEGEK
jgi:hypothetical protein